MTTDRTPAQSLANFLALNRTVVVVLVAVLFFGLGEQLWEPFLSVYLADTLKERKQAAYTSGVVGLEVLLLVACYSALRNLFEGFCYIGGGHITSRLGDRGSLLVFGAASVLGYVLFLILPGPVAAILAALLILGWEPLSVPVTFTTVGSTVSHAGRGMAFAVQSIQKRLPRILGPLIAGFVLARMERRLGSQEAGRLVGMHILVGLALALGLVSLGLQAWWMPHRSPPPPGPSLPQLFRQMPAPLRRLLLAEVFKRWCDHMVREFAVLYLVLVRHIPVENVGILLAIQNMTALLTYLPIGRLTRRTGLQPFIGVTFIFFALFPLALALAPGWWGLVGAFVINGLREIGEPARKATITTLLPHEIRARAVGLYWGIRGFAICPAAFAGALIWHYHGPQSMLFAAFCLGFLGAALFYLLCGNLENAAPPAGHEA
jgi:MFS family permease